MAAKPEILTRRIVGAQKTVWRAAYRFGVESAWRPVCGPANKVLRFTSRRTAQEAARYHAAKHGD